MTSSAFILIIEDDPIVARQIIHTLKSSGLNDTGVAVNRKQALEMTKERSPLLAIIDIKLENSENGIVIAKELTRIQWLPVIFITGTAMEEVLDKVVETNPVAFLEKPLRSNELTAHVKLALKKTFDEKSRFAHGASNGQLFVLSDRHYLRIKHEEILYIQGDRIYATVYLTKEEFNRLYPNAPAYRGTHVSSIWEVYTTCCPDNFSACPGHTW